MQQARSVVTVSTIDERPPAVRPDLRREREPIYESYNAADHGGEEEEEEEEGRDFRESVCAAQCLYFGKVNVFKDNPLGQWVQDHRQQYLEELLRFEGRGDHALDTECCRCGKGVPEYRCCNCLGGGELVCKDCIVASHRQMPFHSIQVSCGTPSTTH